LKEAKLIRLTYIYIIAHFPGLG